jgi:hypothetical protein
LPSALVNWSIQAFETTSQDPALPNGLPWSLHLHEVATRSYHFVYNRDHEIFRSITLTPHDALISELAAQAMETLRGGRDERPLAAILVEFRRLYSQVDALDPRQMVADATAALVSIADLVLANCPQQERGELFSDLSLDDQQEVMRYLASRNIRPDLAISDGTFLRYPPFHGLGKLLDRHPELFFDGTIWEEPYDALDYRDASLTTAARAEVRERFRSRILDAVWLSRLDGTMLELASREELVRALMSIRLLKPDVEPT